METLTISNLTVEFRRDRQYIPVVRDVTFALSSGERLAIVGESGSGKSVTSLAVTRLLPSAARITSGGVVLDGVDLLAMSERGMESVRGGRIAMVFQDALTALDPLFTIEQQIGAVLDRHGRPAGRDERRAASVELLRDVGIAEPERRLSSYPHQLSGGMRQRALIATALAGEPEVLIADEPTTALDVTVQAQIIDLLRRLSVERRMAIILITHDLGVVADFADRVIVMYAGRVVEDSPSEALFDSPRHPYTVGLLESLPRLDEARLARLTAIPGVPPDPAGRPPGCAFAPRCPRADAACAVEPPLITIGARRIACHHPEPVR
jgi:oligopeptide/dipeptide ABC transporter ATP-binding protein